MPSAPKPLANRPLAPTVVGISQAINPNVKPAKPLSREYVHYRRVQLTAQQVSRNGVVDAEQLVRVLNLLQEAAEQGSFAARCAPSVIAVTVQHVPMVNGGQTTIRHGLGYAATGWDSTWAYAAPGLQPFAAVTVANNGGQDPTQCLVLASSANGTYDVRIW